MLPPALNNPRITCITPAITKYNKIISKTPSELIELRTITANPAAGPLTRREEPLNAPITMPPITPAIILDNRRAPRPCSIIDSLMPTTKISYRIV